MKLIPCLVAVSSISFSVAAMAETSPAAGADPMATKATSIAADTTTAPEGKSMAETPMATDASPTDTATTTQAEPTTEQAGFSRGSVVRSIFTSSVQEREPIDKLNNSADAEQIFYFTELRDMSGQTATHRWEYDGKVVAEVKFDVRGPRWRVWSSKSFTPDRVGDWKVSVVNGAGETISEELITMSSIPAGAVDAATGETPSTESVATDAEMTPATTTEPATQDFQPPVNDQLLQ